MTVDGRALADGMEHLPAADLEWLDEYQRQAATTDRSGRAGADSLGFALLGLFGEAGSLLSEVKKRLRDRSSYYGYEASAVEEFGDFLWYLAKAARSLDLPLSTVAVAAAQVGGVVAAAGPGSHEGPRPAGPEVESRLLDLGAAVGDVLASRGGLADAGAASALGRVLACLAAAADEAGVSLKAAARRNLEKAADRYPSARPALDFYDDALPEHERLPRSMRVEFVEHRDAGESPYVIIVWNGVNIGDRLTDNSSLSDNYRFHDVLHLAFAAHLGWSPVLRALLRRKRKGDPAADEQQDGARAVIAEEGVAHMVFSEGRLHGFFEGVDTVDLRLLRAVRVMVAGYEVDDRPTWLWEEAILSAFAVFRQLRAHRGGIVFCDMEARTLFFERRP